MKPTLFARILVLVLMIPFIFLSTLISVPIMFVLFGCTGAKLMVKEGWSMIRELAGVK